MDCNVLKIEDLRTYFYTSEGVVRAVDSVSFEVQEGETLCVVGESGCGKTVTALSILRLIQPPGKILGGDILFEGNNLLTITEDEIRQIRGNKISMIFQEPMTALNPVFTVGDQVAEVYTTHKNMRKREARDCAIDMLQKVGIPDPDKRIKEYPHNLSGGMRQRIMIAMALACDPRILVADEPTTALDVTIQAQILDLMHKLKKVYKSAVILITHDLGVVAEVAKNVVIMYAGKVVEKADVETVFREAAHPYTQGLLNSLPKIQREGSGSQNRLQEIKGTVPSPYCLPRGCHFNPRCPKVMKICKESEPVLKEVKHGHSAACWLIS